MKHIYIYIMASLFSLANLSAQQIAPINPDFIKFRDKKIVIQAPISSIPSLDLAVPKHSLGYIPSPVDLSHLTMPAITKVDSRYTPDGATIADAFYDLRVDDPTKLSPVKDQGQCGACWTFAAFGAMESQLLPTETWDFSENNMKNEHGFDWTHCEGGNTFLSNAYLARWAGPKREVDDPYNESSSISPSTPTYKHLEEALYIAPRTSSTDNDGIKQAILDYGAVSSNMYWDDPAFNSGTTSYYYTAGSDSNHAIVIVGWDDDYSKDNFSPAATADGAFIIRNSWGSSWGDNGYFYISYYDTVIGRIKNLVYSSVGSASNYSKVYDYDPLGWTGGLGYDLEDYMANIFTATGNDALTAVSFYTTDVDVDYVVDVYTAVNSADDPTSGTHETTASTSGTFANAGYHTVSISTVSVTTGGKFSIVVKLTNSSYEYPVAIEELFTGYSSLAAANAGESYISDTGATWLDIQDFSPNSNVCIKAFVTSQDVSPPSNVIGVNDGIGVDIDYVASITTLSANWSVATDAQSGIARYWYALGTTQGGAETIAWTDNGFDVSVTTAGLSLIDEETYYFSVYAENGVGLYSGILSSDGQFVDMTPPPVITTVNDSLGADVNYVNLNNGQLSANWTTTTDTESGIVKYWYAIGTTPGATGTTSGWMDNGLNSSVLKTGLTLSNGSTYYFTVKAENGAGLESVVTNSDGQMLDETLPNTVLNVYDGTGADVEYVGSATTLSANWRASTDTESGILRYWYAIGTSSGANDELDWTNNSLSTEVTKTGLSLTEGQKYYISVKAENNAGLLSVTAYSNGQLVDTSLPIITAVNDSLGADISYTASSVTLSANWTATDDESGIAKYYYAIGTSAGATDIVDWTDNGLTLFVTETGLSLDHDEAYYFSVKAENNIGLESNTLSSSGQLVDITPAPAVTTVSDGTGSDIVYTNSSVQLSAFWSSVEDEESDAISKYQYAIGTIPGAIDTLGWTDSGETLGVPNVSITKVIALTENSTYYFTVRSENAVGLISDVTNSNGQQVDTTSPTAKIEISSNLPAKTGSLEFKLIITEASEISGNPDLTFKGSDDITRTCSLENLNSSTWTGTSFIESYISTGTATFTFSVQDAAGNSGSLITSGSTFNIDTSINGLAGGIVVNSDGTGIIFPAGAYAGTLIINISTPAPASVSSANSNTYNSSTLASTDLNREFTANDMVYNPITTFSDLLTLKIYYPDADNNGRVDVENIAETSLGLYYLNESLQKWILTEDMRRDFNANYIQAQVNHFSIYSIRYVGTAQPAMAQIKVYPNPCKMTVSNLNFKNIPVQATDVKIYIYNVAGNLIRTLDRNDGINILNEAEWDGKNESGKKVSSGLYVYLIKTAAYGNITGKVVITW